MIMEFSCYLLIEGLWILSGPSIIPMKRKKMKSLIIIRWWGPWSWAAPPWTCATSEVPISNNEELAEPQMEIVYTEGGHSKPIYSAQLSGLPPTLNPLSWVKYNSFLILLPLLWGKLLNELKTSLLILSNNLYAYRWLRFYLMKSPPKLTNKRGSLNSSHDLSIKAKHTLHYRSITYITLSTLHYISILWLLSCKILTHSVAIYLYPLAWNKNCLSTKQRIFQEEVC